jgi:hypothetical protein
MLVAAQTAHSTCRGEQKTTQTAVVTNCGSSSDLATTGKTVHTKVELAGNCGDTSNAGGTVMMDKLVSFKALYDDYYEQLYTAKEACSTATANHGTADPPVGKVAECNRKQRSFEMISCERQTALDQYCTDRLNNYNTVKQIADTKRKPEEDHLQGLWGSAYRIKCFIDLVKAVGLDGSAGGSADNITEAEVTGCATETIPFPAQLTFVYTNTSTFGTFACAGTDTHISPDESGFEEHYYNGLAVTKTPQSCTTTTTSMAPTPAPAMHCIKITTGYRANDDEIDWDGGYIKVKINDVLEVNGFYGLNSNVLTKCYVAITSLFVGGGHETDAWVGSILSSTDGGSTYSTMTCISCTENLGTLEHPYGGTTRISVNGNADSPPAPTKCLSGQSCEIRQYPIN